MAKYNFTIESESLEQDISTLVEVVVSAYKECSKIDRDNTTSDLRKEVHGLDNRIDGLEAMIKQLSKAEEKESRTSEDFKEVKKK